MTVNKKVRFEELYPIIEETVTKGNQFSFCAFGVSMLPYIRNGKDLVTLGPNKGDLKANDIVFYRRANGQFVLHRIVRVRKDQSFDLCGDNQYSIEKGVLKSQIIAKFVLLERNGKTIRPDDFSSRIWCFFLPCRRLVLHVWRSLSFRVKKLIKK